MKTILLLLIIFVVSTRATTKEGCMSFYRHYNYKGTKLVACETATYRDFFIKNNFNDQVSSVCAGKGNDWILYQHGNGSGQKVEVKAGQCINVPRAFNDHLSLAKKVRLPTADGCIRFWKHYNYRGRTLQACNTATWREFFIKNNFNDQVSSVCVGKGNDWILYQHANGSGQKVEVKAGQCINVPRAFNDHLSLAKKVRLPTADGCIRFWKHYNYQGRTLQACNTATWREFFVKNNFNDQVSSLCAGKGNDWILYQHANGSGQKVEVKAGQCINVPRAFNDHLSLAKKVRLPTADGCIRFWKHYNYQGRTLQTCNTATWREFFVKNNFNDQVSSVCVGKGNDWILYQHGNGSGQKVEVKAGQCINVPRAFNDHLSLARKIPLKPSNGCIRFYQHYNYQGRALETCNTATWREFFIKNNFNDQVSSVCVGEGNDWILYQHGNGSGQKVEVKAGQCINVPSAFNDHLSLAKKIPLTPSNGCIRFLSTL